MAGSTEQAVPVQREAGVDGAVLDLSDGVWRVQASAAGYWSAAADVTVGRDATADVTIALWPAAVIHGEVTAQSGDSMPEALDLRLSASPTSESEPAAPKFAITRPGSVPSRVELHCPVTSWTWSCVAPALIFDARLEAPGYAPLYEWNVILKTGESADLGPMKLLRTATVFGRVIGKNAAEATRCRATLHPDMTRRGPTDSRTDAEGGLDRRATYPVSLNPRGYFQVVGVAPGRYSLGVWCQGGSGYRDVRVQADAETKLDPPLLLEDLVLDISVAPKVDPAGHPWKLSVYETSPHYLLVTDGAPISTEGRWTRRGLMAGNYHLVVRGSDGTAWLDRYFGLRKNIGPLSLRIGSVTIAGRVRMSMQPVRARLVFRNNAGGESANLISDDQGRFQGLLPFRPDSPETNWTVEAHLARPAVTQQLLNVNVRTSPAGGTTWLDLDLPPIPVHGSVVSPEGKPEPNVQVTFEDSKGIRSSTSTDAEGKFEMMDLSMGKYTATADSHDGSSDRTAFEIGDGGGGELELILHPFKRYSFAVVSSEGPVPDAAVQIWITPGTPWYFTRTDQDGKFNFRLPPESKEVAMTIGAPGYAIKLVRLAISNEGDDSPEARTITLETSGGRLVMNFQPPGQSLSASADSFAPLYLVHKGAIQDARTIAGWGTNQAGASVQGPAVIDAIEAGSYALCRVDPSQVTVLWQGALPSDKCKKGSLEQDDSLTLSPP